VTEKNGDTNSAEWIAEDPSSLSGVYQFSQFGSVTFSSCTVDGYSIISGPIVNEVKLHTPIDKAAPSSLYTGDGETFDVTWLHQ
jgi:Peptidase A4 family